MASRGRYEDAAGTDDALGALCDVIKLTIDECVGDRVQAAWTYGRGRPGWSTTLRRAAASRSCT